MSRVASHRHPAALAMASRWPATAWKACAPPSCGRMRPRVWPGEHNDANVVAVGARQHSEEEALALIDAFLETPFSGDERHQRRIDLMKDYERSVRA